MRFTWRSVSDVLSDKELKNSLGGYGDGYGKACGDDEVANIKCEVAFTDCSTETFWCCGSTIEKCVDYANTFEYASNVYCYWSC